jgi:putative ferrous iron transport protein C
MILSEVRDYLRRRGQASLQDLALHFDCEPDAVRGMLEHWIRKGKVTRRLATTSCGGSCTQCLPEAVELYTWGDADPAPREAPLIRNLKPCGED